MVKATSIPMVAKGIDASVCVFCTKGELAILSVTSMAFPMGQKCYEKSLKRNIEWDEDTTLKDLKSRLRRRDEL
jgi:hypothetical protein